MFQVRILMGVDDPLRMVRMMVIILFPKIAKFFKVPFINVEATDYIVSVIK
jgi:hypothetical protein